ncbi:MAG: HD domain-containing protein [Flavobacteriales bacterium]|nr:HD domain-containing protein [Flavobacteriales bacterium]
MKKSSKIINDPLYGFISLKGGIILNLIEHPYFQRLRRISQLGLTNMVYPGANHTRFHHALGAMHLMHKAIQVLRFKGIEISVEEADATKIAILLHDIGHGPFSHALEHSIAEDISHEELSLIFMEKLNLEFEGKLSLAISIFKNKYSKAFLHQLVSSQLDMDRLDYLNRDSFYSGVQEGIIGAERIINMLNVYKGNLVVESKGIYSVEKFLIARRLMYWQVYFHKTVVCAEQILIKILQRAKELSRSNIDLVCSSSLKIFLNKKISTSDLTDNTETFTAFTNLDDYDIYSALKEWQYHSDRILSTLSKSIVNRNLFKVKLEDDPLANSKLSEIKKNISEKYALGEEEIDYFFISGEITNSTYKLNDSDINIIYKDNRVADLISSADKSTISALTKNVKKYFYCLPKDLFI